MNQALRIALAVTLLLPLALDPLAAQESNTATSFGGVRSFGQADYSWRIRALGGRSITLSDFKGRVLFINLWASWCTPCVRELKSIERLKQRLAGTKVEFLIIAAEGERSVEQFLRRYPYDLPIYLEEQRAPAAFGLRGLPSSWVIDQNGQIVLVRYGEAVWDRDAIEQFLRALAIRQP